MTFLSLFLPLYILVLVVVVIVAVVVMISEVVYRILRECLILQKQPSWFFLVP